MIKPRLWPRIEFFSFGGQESQRLCVIQQQHFTGGLQFMGSQRVRPDWAIKHTHTHILFYILSNIVYHLNIVPCAIQRYLVLFVFLLFPAHNSFPTSGTGAILSGDRIFIPQLISFWRGCQQLHFKPSLLTQGHSPSIVTCWQWLAYRCDLRKANSIPSLGFHETAWREHFPFLWSHCKM